jgi:hypothetical protein
VLTSWDNTTWCGRSACRQPQHRGGPGRVLDCGRGHRVARLAAPANTASPRAGESEVRQARNLRQNKRPHGCQPRENGVIRDGRNKVRSSGERFAIESRFKQTKRSSYDSTRTPMSQARDKWIGCGLIAWRRESPRRSRTEVGETSLQISSNDNRAQMIGRIFTGSISLCGENERFVAAVDDSTGWIGCVSWCSSECAPRFQRELQGGYFLLKTRADFSMNVSPEPGEPTRSQSSRRRAFQESLVPHGLVHAF